MEMADGIVINKADGNNVDKARMAATHFHKIYFKQDFYNFSEYKKLRFPLKENPLCDIKFKISQREMRV